MANIMIDTDKISNSLIPSVEGAKSKISNAKEKAQKVHLPHSCPYSWSSIISDIGDCSEKLGNYLSWIREINRRINVTNTNSKEDISKIKIEEVKRQNIIVK